MSGSKLRQAGFTLIELLVVIFIIGILATVLLTQVGTANQSAIEFQCQSNLRNLYGGIQNYKLKHSGSYPAGGGRKFLWSIWRELEHSDNNRRMFFCPEVLSAAQDLVDLKSSAADFWKQEEDLPREAMSYAARAPKHKRGMDKASEAIIADANDGVMNHKTGNTVVLYGDGSVKLLLKTDLEDAGIWPTDDPDFVLTTGEGSVHKDLSKLTID